MRSLRFSSRMSLLSGENHYLLCWQIGEVAKLKPVEVELKRLEDLSEAIVQDFARMRKNEEEMRDTNGKKKRVTFYYST